MFIDSLDGLESCPDLEFSWAHDGMEMVPGYFVDCTDGHRYLVFAPDMSSVKHMHAYARIMWMVKKRITDHEYEPVRDCIHPAFSRIKSNDECEDYEVFKAPASEMGKIYLVL